MNATRIKTISASVAFIPFVGTILQRFGFLQQRAMSIGLTVFYLPVLGLESLVRTFHPGQAAFMAITLILMALWSWLIATVFWKIASGFLAEDEPDKKFDWIGFQVRFFCGAVLGALLGWRFWIGLYRGHGDEPTNTWASLLICVAVEAQSPALRLGLGYREDFWRRPPL